MTEERLILKDQVAKEDFLDKLDSLALDEIIMFFNSLKSTYEYSGWSDLRVFVRYHYDYTELILKGSRKETDKEYADRMLTYKKATNQEKEEYEKYLKLKKKYEGK